MRRFGRSRGLRRPKLGGAWTGRTDLATSIAAATPVVSFVLWDDLISQRLNASGKVYHRHTFLQFGIRPSSFSPAAGQSTLVLGWYLYVFTTDDVNNVPTASIFDPLDAGPTVHEKALLDMGLQTWSPRSGTSQDGVSWWVKREVKAIRKFDDTDALLLVVQAANMDAAVPVQFDLMSRTYCNWR